jgi:serine/threonine protein kinase
MIQLEENGLFGEHSRYRLIRLLGCGGFSEVWLAEDTQTGLTVALKVYAPGKGLDENGVTQFRKEFKMVFNLNHPNLLRPSHYDVYERMPYLIMPYCEQGSSIKLIGKIDEKTAWQFLHDVASGLAYLNGQKTPVIHQDIKPHNVLIDNNNTFVIADFGISSEARSTLRQSMKSDNQGTGTMAYMAPERFGGLGEPIFASDIWSLGASLFEMMTGELPFGEHGGLAQNRGAKIPRINGDWSDELKKMVNGCLQKDTWKRPKAQNIAIEADVFMKHPPSPPCKGVKKSFIVLAVLAALILGLCAGFFTGRSLNKPNPRLHECISIIEQADAVFNETDLSTWKETMKKYREAKELTDRYSLQLPNMQHRITLLRKKMDDMINVSIENAKKAFAVRSEMALFLLKDALEIDPDHKEAKTLYEQYKKAFPQRE